MHVNQLGANNILFNVQGLRQFLCDFTFIGIINIFPSRSARNCDFFLLPF